MLIKYTLINVLTGKGGIPGYFDSAEVSSWNAFDVPDDLPPGWHRTLRNKRLTTVTLKSGVMNYTDEEYNSISARILRARGQDHDAAAHEAAAEIEKSGRKSPMSIS